MNFFMKSAQMNFFKSNYTVQRELVCVDENNFFQKSRKIMDSYHQYQSYYYQFHSNPVLQQQHRPLTFEEWLYYNNINNGSQSQQSSQFQNTSTNSNTGQQTSGKNKLKRTCSRFICLEAGKIFTFGISKDNMDGLGGGGTGCPLERKFPRPRDIMA